MAITNAQQYKQLLSNGGSTNDISLEEAKDMAPKGEFLAYINKKEAKTKVKKKVVKTKTTTKKTKKI